MFQKSVLTALILSFGLSIATPRPSEAGIVIGTSLGSPVIGGVVGGVAGMAASFGSFVWGMGLPGGDGDVRSVIATAGFFLSVPAFVVLDADASLGQNELEMMLANELPWIDNREVIADAARLFKLKYEESLMADPTQANVAVSLSRDEVIDLLAPTGISPGDSPVEFEKTFHVLN